jgi:hypothetical protein
MDFPNHSVKIGPAEIDSLLGLKSNLDQREAISNYALKYQLLGWEPAALDARDGADLKVDFATGPEVWIPRLWESDLMDAQINLGVSTGKQTGIITLEVNEERGASLLDQYGDWRSECIAVLENGRERHFYAWEPSPLLEALSAWTTPGFSWYGEGQVVLAPPSFDPETGETWVWLSPPWQRAPQLPKRSLWRFLQEHLAGKPAALSAVTLTWQEIYCLVSPHESLLQALYASPQSMEGYYQGIIQAAGEAGLTTPEVLRALLWHAPWGDAPQHPETWHSLEKLVLEAQASPKTGLSPIEFPFELILDRAISMVKQPASGHSGPPGFFRRLLANPPQAGAADRQPFSKHRQRK